MRKITICFLIIFVFSIKTGYSEGVSTPPKGVAQLDKVKTIEEKKSGEVSINERLALEKSIKDLEEANAKKDAIIKDLMKRLENATGENKQKNEAMPISSSSDVTSGEFVLIPEDKRNLRATAQELEAMDKQYSPRQPAVYRAYSMEGTSNYKKPAFSSESKTSIYSDEEIEKYRKYEKFILGPNLRE